MSNHFNAFPMMPSHTNPDTVTAEYRGLTKRELFAAMAMQGLCSTFTVGRDQHELQTATAESAVKYADALIAELAKAKE